MRLAAYLERVGFEGTPRADLDTLRRLHRAHVLAIPYENLDVQLRRPVSLDARDVYEKLVERRRGGWCYEMCGLLAWALEEIGFRVTRMEGAVWRAQLGEISVGNHLVLRVDLERPYLADVGLGDGILEPVPLAVGPIRQGWLEFRLEQLGESWWRFHNHPHGAAPSFDFRNAPGRAETFAAQCERLQTDPASNFVLNAVCKRHVPDRIEELRGRTRRTVRDTGVEQRLLESADEYVDTLARVFGLDLPEAASLWPCIVARHEELFGARPPS
jgi:N-hydroxyarylamine O-acetyltransferase